MDSFIQLEHRKKDREKQKIGGLDGPILATVQATNSREDTALVDYYATRGRQVLVGHPFVGADSWIRCLPSTGTNFLVQMRSDNAKPTWIASKPIGAYRKLEAYEKGQSLYRILKEGEIDVFSSGWTGSFYSTRYQLDHRAGIVKSWLDQNGLETGAKAPIHRRLLHHNKSSSVGDEERFGIVKRPTSAIDNTYVKVNSKYVKEYLLNIKNPAGSAPTTLLDKREGHVIDDKGNPVKHQLTNKNLRLQHIWYTNSDQSIINQIDENGNILWTLPEDAREGFQFNVLNGNYKIIAKKDINETSEDGSYLRTIKKDDTLTIGGEASRTITKNYKLNALTVRLNETGGQGTLNMDGGKVAFGTPAVEVLDIISQTLDALTQAQTPGFGGLLHNSPLYAQLKAKIESIRGTLGG